MKNEPMSNRPQTYNAIRKLMSSLDDPFTRFLEPSRLAALRRGTAGVTTTTELSSSTANRRITAGLQQQQGSAAGQHLGVQLQV